MLFITFIPWLLFWLILAVHKSEPAAVAGCAAPAFAITSVLAAIKFSEWYRKRRKLK